MNFKFKKIKKIIILIILVFAFNFASASQLTQAQISAIINMLQAFGANANTIAEISATLNGASYHQGETQTHGGYTTSGNYSVNQAGNQTGYCPQIARNLSRGARGQDVRELQEYLKQTGDYTYPEITGYFGRATEKAVQRFQSRVGVISYGTPASTGFGLVGPATRRALSNACGFTPNASPATNGLLREFLVTPKAGSIPFISAVVFSYQGSDCTAFTLDWGDGSTPIIQYPQNSGSCDDYIVKKTARHTYVKEGDFTITLTVRKNGITQTYTQQVHSGTSFANHFDIAPTEGDAPLLVGISFLAPDNNCVSYKIDWGDGSQDSKVATQDTCETNNKVKTVSTTHSYSSNGNYTLKLYLGTGDLSSIPIVEQRQVFVREANYGSGVTVKKTTVTVSPTSGKAPLVTKVILQGKNEECTSYRIDWGDGTTAQLKEAQMNDCDSGSFTREFIHTYFIPGTYTIKARAGEGNLYALHDEYQYVTVTN